MTLKVLAAEPSTIVLGDSAFLLKISADGCASLEPTGGKLHTCDLAKLQRLIGEARRMAGQHFGSAWEG